MTNPYSSLPARSFWRTAVAEPATGTIDDLWRPKFSISKAEPVATLGSCFAQNISRALVYTGFNWLNAEPAPPHFPETLKAKFQYDLFSVRVGNIYTIALLKQWVEWAFELATVPPEIWCEGGRFYDPFRPRVEPDGFASENELLATRAQTLRAVRHIFERCGVFIFTLGLTEAWRNSLHGHVYPMCPGTLASSFDANVHCFVNFGYAEILADLDDVIQILRQHNPQVKIILAVSPVPLTATASRDHVLVATTYSKSVLRAIAGAAADRPYVDYFPLYEMISSFPFSGRFYEPNMRSVSKEGVDAVMQTFLTGISGAAGGPLDVESQDADSSGDGALHRNETPSRSTAGDEVCEDMLLEAFGR